MEKFIIPNKLNTYKEGSEPKLVPKKEDILFYEVSPTELVRIVFWVQYPSYDFIFGVPIQTSKRHEKEIGFYRFRDSRCAKYQAGVFCDKQECEELIQGFQKILKESKVNSPHLW